MPDIRPFRGLRYASHVDLPLAVAPPYDVIDVEDRASLAEQPHNAVRLILPEPGPAGDGYAQAAATLQTWRNGGILSSEPVPAFYIYAQTFRFLGGEPLTRAGIIGAVAHGPGIWGHERTHQGPKDDRFALLSACRANLSPIFGLVEDGDGAIDRAVTDAMSAHPAADFTDAAGVHHRMWVEADPARCAAIARTMHDAHVVIADGHHRYETSVTYAEEVGGPGSDAVMMMCVSLKSPGLRLYPYHRMLARLPVSSEADLEASVPAGWTQETLPGGGDVWPQAEARLAELRTAHHAFALYTPGTFRLVHVARDPQAVHPSGLDVVVLQRHLFENAWGLDIETLGHQGDLTYTPDGAEACLRVHEGEANLAVLVNPVPRDSVVACARAGKRMPQKSTYFHPKLLTGLVIRSLADDPG